MHPGGAKLCRAKFAFCIFSKILTIYSRKKHTNKQKNKVKKIKFSKISYKIISLSRLHKNNIFIGNNLHILKTKERKC